MIINTTTSSNNRGIYLYFSNSNTLSNITANSNNCGIELVSSDYNNISNVIANSNTIGIQFYVSSDYNTIKNSIVQNNNYGIYLLSSGANLIYNNLFNNTNNYYFSGAIYANNWNTTIQTGTSIHGLKGNYIGGNFWTNPSGTGYSDTCDNLDNDQFCDNAYTLTTDNIDYLPLASAYVRKTSEPINYIDYLKGNLTLTRKPDISTILTELISKISNIYKKPIQGFSIIEFIKRISTLSRIPSVSAIVSDVVKRLTVLSRATAKSFGLTENIKKIVTLLRGAWEYFSMGFGLKSYYSYTYHSVQYDIPYFTNSGSKDVKFYQTTEINTYGATITLTRTLPEGVDEWIVYNSSECSGTVLNSGTGNVATWQISSTQKINNTVCYTYLNGVTLNSISWSQYDKIASNLTTQIIYTPLIFTENVGEDFNVSWDITNLIPSGALPLENITCENCPANGGININATAYGDWIPEQISPNIQGYAEIMKMTEWTKSVYLENDFSQPLKINVTIGLPSCYVYAWVVNPEGQNETVQNLTGMIAWNETLSSGQNGTWIVHFNTPIINVSRNETAVVNQIWYRYFDVDNVCVALKNVKAYAPYSLDYVSISLYDNSTGIMEDISGYSDYAFRLNTTEYMAYWNIPTLSTKRNFVLMGTAVECTLLNRTIINYPLTTMENVEWLEQISCRNMRTISSEYVTKWRMIFEARDIKIDGIPTEKSIDEYGAYIMLKGSLGPLETVVRNVTYKTDPVTAEITFSYPTDRKEWYVVDKEAEIRVNVTVKSWSALDINQTITKEIPIIYGRNLMLWYEGNLIDQKAEVTGKYDLIINGIKAFETKNYFINFTIPTAESRVVIERPDPQTGFQTRTIEVKSITPYTLIDLRYKTEIPYENIKKVINYDTKANLTWDIEKGETYIALGSLESGKSMMFTIYYTTPVVVPDIIKTIGDWFTTRHIYIPILSDITGKLFTGLEAVVINFTLMSIPIILYYYRNVIWGKKK
jgi:parallel beta-helix repeat protein